MRPLKTLNKRTMKKLFAILTVAAFMTACNDGDTTKTTTTNGDTTITKEVPKTDSTTMSNMDTSKKMMNDATKMADTSKKMMDKAADKMKDAADKMKANGKK